MRVPIYPSSQVLFPGQLFPVRREGGRVQRMLAFCGERDLPLGVVWVSGRDGNTLADVGTLAPLLASKDHPHLRGAMLVGQQRFRILQIHQDRVYLEATVRVWPWVNDPRPSWELVEQVGAYLRRYVRTLSDVLPPTLLPEALFPNVSTLGVMGAALLQLPSEEKLRLLELPTTYALLSAVLRYMRVYVPMAERLAAIPPQVFDTHKRISFN